MIKLSVIIPIYNTPKLLLEHCIASVQENILYLSDEVEILMINDGSTEPHIEEVLKAAEEQDERFKYIFKPNSGVSETRNRGIEMARGDYITCLDSDDTLRPNALAHMLKVIREQHPEMAILGCFSEYNPRFSSEIFQAELSQEDIADLILTMCSGYEEKYMRKGLYLDNAVAKLYKIEFLEKYNISYNSELVIGEDSIFNLSCLSVAKHVYMDNTCVYHYVFNQESAMRKPSPLYMHNLPNLLKSTEEVSNHPLLVKEEIIHAICWKCVLGIRYVRQFYLTHPSNDKSFWELKKELDILLSNPYVRKYTKLLRLSDAHDKQELKNIVLLKLHLYWIFLITERRKRRMNHDNSL